MVSQIKDGKKHGKERTYQAGIAVIECDYEAGQKHGTCLNFYTDGRRIKTMRKFSDGKLTEETKF